VHSGWRDLVLWGLCQHDIPEVFGNSFSQLLFIKVKLGLASLAEHLNQELYGPGVGLIKSGVMTNLNVRSCRFANITVLGVTADGLPAEHGALAHEGTAVVVAAAHARVAHCSFRRCFTPAVVFAYSGDTEMLGRVGTYGSFNRGNREDSVSLLLFNTTLAGNVNGVFAAGYQVIISDSKLSESRVAGVHISAVPCLVINNTVFDGAAIDVERASNPGGVAFSFCRNGWFPALPLPGSAANGTGQPTQDVATPVSVYLEGVSISGVRGRAAFSMSDVHKASLQHVRIVDNRGGGGLQASSVAGMLLLQCEFLRNVAAPLGGAKSGAAGGASLTAVQDLYLFETTFADNVGAEAGAMLLQSCGSVSMKSCSFQGNQASQNGGGIRAIATQSITVDTSTVRQPQDIRCMQTDMVTALFNEFFAVQLNDFERVFVICRKGVVGGKPTTFRSNAARGSGGAIAVEGLYLADVSARSVAFSNNW
jgi:predicted outer membrane repeat protein